MNMLASIPLRARVLEIGCGTGGFARELATRRGARVTAVDPSATKIDLARLQTRASLGIEYRVASFSELQPRGFDVVMALGGLYGLDLADALRRMADAVVPGGTVVLAGVCSPWSWLVGGPQELRDLLPGVAVRRHLGWRYTATWRRPYLLAGPV